MDIRGLRDRGLLVLDDAGGVAVIDRSGWVAVADPLASLIRAALAPADPE